MVIRLVGVVFLFFYSFSVVAKEQYSPEQYIKNYAIAICVSLGYSNESVKNDAAAAARGYLEFGDYSLAAHTAVRKLGKEFLSREYQSQSGQPMIMVKCIDFYHSSELAELILRYEGKTDN